MSRRPNIDPPADRENIETFDVPENEALASANAAQHEGDAIDAAERTFEPSEPSIDAAAQAALDEARDRIEREGVDLENFISMRTFATQESLMANVGAKPRGHELPLGLIIGVVHQFERKPSTLPVSNKPNQAAMPDSIRLKGMFEATVYETGEIVTATGCYLPAVMAEAIETALLDGALNVRLNMEISCVATGRMIPYRFKVRSFVATPEQTAIAAMRMQRLKALGRENVLAKIAGPAAKPAA